MVARYDLTNDPQLQADLLTVRRGTAFWHRKVEELSDAELDSPTLLPGWTRRHLIAHVGYNARAITRLVQWANTGVETPMYASAEQRNQEIQLGATMPARALRNLNHHAAVSLNVEWRDTPVDVWSVEVRTAQGRTIPLAETVWMRTREVWLHAIDLNNGATTSELPDNVAERLLGDILTTWKNRGTDPGYDITITDQKNIDTLESGPSFDDALSIRGSLPAILAWASGRDTTPFSKRTQTTPPRWI